MRPQDYPRVQIEVSGAIFWRYSFAKNWAIFFVQLTLDTIQGLCIMLGMNVCINWISRSNLSERINIVRSTNIIKEVSKVWAYGTTIGHFLNYFVFW